MNKVVRLALTNQFSSSDLLAQKLPTKPLTQDTSPALLPTISKTIGRINSLTLDAAGNKPVEFAAITLVNKGHQFRVSANGMFGKLTAQNQLCRKKKISSNDAKSDDEGQ